MKKKELSELKDKPEDHLLGDLSGYRDKLNRLRLDLSMGKVSNIKEIKSIKKSIAQILTILNEKKKAKNKKQEQ